jgi:hypothetical protein
MKIANPLSPPFSKGGLGGFESYFLSNPFLLSEPISKITYPKDAPSINTSLRFPLLKSNLKTCFSPSYF